MKFSEEQKIILKKNGVHVSGGCHIYLINLESRYLFLDYSSPYSLQIGTKIFKSSNWGELLEAVANFLIETGKISNDELLNFRVDWSKKAIFSSEKLINHKKLNNPELFINLNQTATHYCFLLSDILKLFSIPFVSVELFVVRAPFYEPEEVHNIFQKNAENELKNYLVSNFNFSDEKIKSFFASVKTVDKEFHQIFPSKKTVITLETKLDLYRAKEKLMKRSLDFESKKSQVFGNIVKILCNFTNEYIAKNKAFFGS